MMVLRGASTASQLKALPGIDGEMREIKGVMAIEGSNAGQEIDIDLEEDE